ncbi:MAG: flagellar biosynthetic protein FliR [Pseudomonadota bacterium]|nr:flagellar biosynthetic protein FliR [Pseudomonadota bacterium]
MDGIERFAAMLALAFLRYVPAVVLPGLTPLRWAPVMVRMVLAVGLAWLTVLAMPLEQTMGPAPDAMAWTAAAAGELMVGLVFGLVLMIPQAALHTAGWLVDVQAGLSAGTLFNPGGQGDVQSLLGAALMLAATVVFFTLDLHLDLYRALVASTRVIPVGQGGTVLDLAGFLGLLGSSFLLGLVVVLPIVLGLLAVDFGVAYAMRSMPQANVYFLMLPLKVMVALLLMVATLPLVPAMLERLFRDAFARVPAMLGV